MYYKFEIMGRLPSINEYTSACRTNPYLGAKMKRQAEELVCQSLMVSELNKVELSEPIELYYAFYEKNKRRDLDNISGFAHKVIQDALVRQQVIKDDGWDEIIGMRDTFHVDNNNPRIEVVIHLR